MTEEIALLKSQADETIANGTGDAYFLALLSDSLYNLNRTEEARVYADEITKYAQDQGNVSRSLTTITTSDGSQRIIETTAISVIAWMNE